MSCFEAGNGISIAKIIFYAHLKALDTMSKISVLDYRDSPVVFTELVKFLSSNISVEAVDRLETLSIQFIDSVKQMNKEVTDANKAAHTEIS